jgi:hypothetical protein
VVKPGHTGSLALVVIVWSLVALDRFVWPP